MTTAAFIQARMGATRLPGKPLLKVLGRPLLSYLIERLKRAKSLDEVIVVTSTSPRDDAIETEALKNGVKCFRGSEENVLERFYQAAQHYHPEVIVRITADCPLIDPAVIDAAVNSFKLGPYDYVSNALERTYPRGMDVEVFSFKALAESYLNAKENYEKEHVTPYIYRHPQNFVIGHQKQPENHSEWRWTVDTQEDFAVVSKLLASLYPKKPNFTLHDLTTLFLQHPEWLAMNSHIIQKTLPPQTNG